MTVQLEDTAELDALTKCISCGKSMRPNGIDVCPECRQVPNLFLG